MKTFLLVCIFLLIATDATAASGKQPAESPSVDTQLALIAQGVSEINSKLVELAADVRILRAEVGRKADREELDKVDDKIEADRIAVASIATEVDGLKKKIDSISSKGFDFMSGTASAVVGALAAFLFGLLVPKK